MSALWAYRVAWAREPADGEPYLYHQYDWARPREAVSSEAWPDYAAAAAHATATGGRVIANCAVGARGYLSVKEPDGSVWP